MQLLSFHIALYIVLYISAIKKQFVGTKTTQNLRMVMVVIRRMIL